MQEDRQYTPEEASHKIANNDHSFRDHQHEFLNDWYGEEVGIYDKDDYEQYINQTIQSEESYIYSQSPGVDFYYDKSHNGLVIVNTNRPNGGTCYRPADREEKLVEIVQNGEISKGMTPNEASKISFADIPQGGYQALYSDKEFEFHDQENIQEHEDAMQQTDEVSAIDDLDLSETPEQEAELDTSEDIETLNLDAPDNSSVNEASLDEAVNDFEMSDAAPDASDSAVSGDIGDSANESDIGDTGDMDAGDSTDGPDVGDD